MSTQPLLNTFIFLLALMNTKVLSEGRESKDLENGEIRAEVKFKFPASNSLTSVDRKYFGMIRSEAEWGNSTLNELEEAEEEPIKPGNERSRSPESFSLTETDREYFNIIKTEDGLSQFYKSISSPRGKLSNNDKATANNLRTKFRYHIVTSSNKRIVGLYLPHQ